MADHATFEHPLQGRYASDEMKRLFSDDVKFGTWRKIWYVIAKLQNRLGLSVTAEQVAELERGLVLPIDYASAAAHEKRLKHDVMAHVHAFGEACPSARPIIHRGCTSCDITDNAELIVMRDALGLVALGIAKALRNLERFAAQYRDLPTLGYTHYQAAQPTTVGKRACLWAQDLLMDLMAVERLKRELPLRGLKGATGTQASFSELFGGDANKLSQFERGFVEELGFGDMPLITGQTYTRKQDTAVIQALASFAASAAKFANDLRHLAHDKELEEPFGAEQVGSSAMPYKRNPMMCERIVSLARYLMSLPENALHTHAEQWLERTLDDSANRRLVISEAFLTADAILLILQKVTQGIVVYPHVIERRLREELPFLVSEQVIAGMVNAGADRQDVHERMRRLSQEAGSRVKHAGLDNNLRELLMADPFFDPIHRHIDKMLDPNKLIGRAPQQVDDFLECEVRPALRRYEGRLGGTVELKV